MFSHVNCVNFATKFAKLLHKVEALLQAKFSFTISDLVHFEVNWVSIPSSANM